MGLRGGKLPLPSNVTRLTQAIKPLSSDGIQQVIYYQAGIGSTGSFLNRVIGGATAQGLSENIRNAYAFIANNYAMGDEIFLFGFSRGAFTARSVAGFIAGVGLLTKAGITYLAEVFKDFENRENPRYRPAYPDQPIPDKPSASSPAYTRELAKVRAIYLLALCHVRLTFWERGLSRIDVPIKVVGVFDTVGKYLPLNTHPGHVVYSN